MGLKVLFHLFSRMGAKAWYVTTKMDTYVKKVVKENLMYARHEKYLAH